MIKTCAYDNPSTFCRELYVDGKLICHYTAELLESVHGIPPRHFHMGANVGPWKSGQIVGDHTTLPSK